MNGNFYGVFTYIKIILKAYFFSAISFGLLVALIQSANLHSLSEGFKDGIEVGIIFSFFVISPAIIVDVAEKLRFYLKYNVTNFSLSQNINFQIQEEYYLFFNDVLEVLSSTKWLYVNKADPKTGIIEVTTRFTWKSIGESIKIEINQFSSNPILLLKITSKPKISFTFIDYCKNIENVQKIKDSIVKRHQ